MTAPIAAPVTAENEALRAPAAGEQSSFYYAFLLLPAARRRAILEVYAFLRAADDAVDEPGALPLEVWSAELDRVYGGAEPEQEAGRALRRAVRAFDIPRRHFDSLLRGCAMDRDGRRYERFEELEDYCWHVAGVVGRACLPIFGVAESEAGEYADRLGIALQLVNIVRDVGEDARRGRVYLPREDLVRFGVAPEELLAPRANERVRALLAFEGERAEAALARARALLPRARATRRKLLSAQVMGAVYAALLARVRREGYPSLERRVRLSRSSKLWVAARTWLRVQCGC
ncbi:MAG: squalene/phytoene synthase family protein [Planctomycetes bacterium]|nr:squalene/phytoene synthase family protein [Planctomycetota bacterium]